MFLQHLAASWNTILSFSVFVFLPVCEIGHQTYPDIWEIFLCCGTHSWTVFSSLHFVSQNLFYQCLPTYCATFLLVSDWNLIHWWLNCGLKLHLVILYKRSKTQKLLHFKLHLFIHHRKNVLHSKAIKMVLGACDVLTLYSPYLLSLGHISYS